MEAKHILLGLIEAVVWYGFIFYWLYPIRKPEGNLWIASAGLLGLFYLGFVLCPWGRHTVARQQL